MVRTQIITVLNWQIIIFVVLEASDDSVSKLNNLFETLRIEENSNQINIPNEVLSHKTALNNLEITYLNRNMQNWNQANFQIKKRIRLHRRHVPRVKHLQDDSLYFKQNLMNKLNWYKHMNCMKAKVQPKSKRLSISKLWNVYSAPSHEWMMSGDCKDSAKVLSTRRCTHEIQLLLPVITNSENQKWLDVSFKDVEDVLKNLKTKSCFRIRHLVFQRNRNYGNGS